MGYKSGGTGFVRGLVVGGIAFAGLFLIPKIIQNDNLSILILATFALGTIISIILGIVHHVKGRNWPSPYVVGSFTGFATVFDIITILYAFTSKDLIEFIHRVLI